jgi:hypothetical protein
MIKKVLIGMFLTGIICIAALCYFSTTILATVIKKGVEAGLPQLTKTSGVLNDVDISIMSGTAKLEGFVLGNPKGFQADSALQLREMKVTVDIMSLLSDTVVINDIVIDAPVITYDYKKNGSNFSVIMDNVESFSNKSTKDGSSDSSVDSKNKKGETSKVDWKNLEDKIKEKASEKGTEADSGSDNTTDDAVAQEETVDKKVIIEHFVLKNAKLNVYHYYFDGEKFEVPMVTVEVNDIGKDTNGTTFSNASKEIISSLNNGVIESSKKLMESKEFLEKIAKKKMDELNKKANEKLDKLNLDPKSKKEANKLLNKIKGLF